MSLSCDTNCVFHFGNTTFDYLLDQNGDAWFIGKQITEFLGYANHTKAFRNHIPEHCKLPWKELKKVCPSQGYNEINLNHNQILINESGLYRLTVGSSKPFAKTFKDFIYDKLLPTIRKTGKYQLTSPDRTLELRIAEIQLKQKQIDFEKHQQQIELEKQKHHQQVKNDDRQFAIQMYEKFRSNPDTMLKQSSINFMANILNNNQNLQPQQISYLDVPEILRRINRMDLIKQSSQIGAHLAKKYRELYHTEPNQAEKVINGSSRHCNVYASDKLEMMKQWINEKFQNSITLPNVNQELVNTITKYFEEM